jgi:hypothetical protein
MKKNLLLFLVFILASSVFSQKMDYTKEGFHYYIVSPNGRYYTGTINEGPGCFYDVEEKKHKVTDIDSVLLFAINNDGIACGAYMGKPGVWVRGAEWKMFTALETINNKPIESGEICGMSADGTKYIALLRYDGGKSVPVYLEVDKFDNWDDKNAWNFSTLPTPNKDDVLYKQSAQFVQICGMNDDGTRILGRYVLQDGKRELPFIWDLGLNGEWSIRFVAQRCLFIDDVINGTLSLPDDREEMTSDAEIQEYDRLVSECEKGIIFDLSPYSMFAWTGKGRYIPVCSMVRGSDIYSEYISHAAVIDIEKDTLIVFTAVEDAGTVSVNNKGEVMIYSPQKSYFRTSFVASVDNPSQVTPLFDYTKQRSNGVVDLEPLMTYQRDIDFDGNPIYVSASGSAIWANEGNAFVTFNYDEVNESQIPHCYMVRFEDQVAVDNLNKEQLVVYPNPTNGILYFENQLSNITVYDIAGRCVYAQVSADQMVDLTSLNTGAYLLTGECNGENFMTKIFVVK